MPAAITGMAATTAFGDDLGTIWGCLSRGQSAVVPITLEAKDDVRLKAAVMNPELSSSGGHRMAQMLANSIGAALSGAALSAQRFSVASSAIVLGTSFGDSFSSRTRDGYPDVDAFIDHALSAVSLDTVQRLLISSACSSGADAIALGADMIDAGEIDVALVGGVDIVDQYKLMGHSSLGTLAEETCRPFDRRADGTVLGDGAGLLVLESESHRNRRRGPLLARLVGHSATTDVHSLTSPDDEASGASRAILQALDRADKSPTDVVYINAHGSGTPVNDAMEARAVATVFGADAPPISSTKSALGHTLGATGAIEAIVAVKSLMCGRAVPTAGLQVAHRDWQGRQLPQGTDTMVLPEKAGACVLSVTYGFGGANTCLAFAGP